MSNEQSQEVEKVKRPFFHAIIKTVSGDESHMQELSAFSKRELYKKVNELGECEVIGAYKGKKLTAKRKTSIAFE